MDEVQVAAGGSVRILLYQGLTGAGSSTMGATALGGAAVWGPGMYLYAPV
jgi:hypothetical protein